MYAYAIKYVHVQLSLYTDIYICICICMHIFMYTENVVVGAAFGAGYDSWLYGLIIWCYGFMLAALTVHVSLVLCSSV